MILAAPYLQLSITILIVIHVIVSLLMILIVMMQRPKQEGLGAAFGGAMTDQLLGAGTTSFLQKATIWLGCLFFTISLVLAILVAHKNQVTGKIDEGKVVTPVENVAAPENLTMPTTPAETSEGDAEMDSNLNILEAAGAEPEASEESTPAEPAEEMPAEENVVENPDAADTAEEISEDPAPEGATDEPGQ